MPCLTVRVLSRRRSSAAISGVHVGEDGGDGALLWERGTSDEMLMNIISIQRRNA